mgnify:CR=1 FL=1
MPWAVALVLGNARQWAIKSHREYGVRSQMDFYTYILPQSIRIGFPVVSAVLSVHSATTSLPRRRSIVKAAGDDSYFGVDQLVDNAVFLIDPSGPAAL